MVSVAFEKACIATRRPFSYGRKASVRCLASKGFGADSTSAKPEAPITENVSTSSGATKDSAELLEDKIRARRGRKAYAVPKVNIESPVVDYVTGKGPRDASRDQASELETAYVQFLFFVFVFCILQGLVIAGSGFLPEEADTWIAENLYPAFSPSIIAFLGFSSLYGLAKTGLLPGQKKVEQ